MRERNCKMKKVIALILALSLFGTSALAFSSSTLSQYGMNFSGDDSRLVLRAEFIEDILRLMQIEPVSSTQQVFDDVKETDSFYGAVMAAYDAGIVHGEPGMKFRPDEPVTYDEAIRVFVDILKYDVYVKTGETYQSVASKIKLTSGVKYKKSAYVNEKDMSRLFFNAMDIPMFEIKYENGNTVLTEGETILENHNIYKGKGVVRSVGNTTLDSGINIGKGLVTIETERFQTNGRNYDEYLGCCVDYLYYDDDGDYTLIAVELSEKTEITTIQLYDVAGYSKRVLSYYEGNKTKRAKLDSDVSIIYNGALVEKMSDDLFLGDNGSVRLISSDGAYYDTVIITKYDDYFVDTLNLKTKVVYDRYNQVNGQQRSLDLSGVDDDKIVNEKGKPVDLASIEKYSVLSAVIRENGEIEKVIVGSSTVEGVVSSINSDNYIVIEKNSYKGTNSLFSNEYMSTSVAGTFYLNVNGMIAGVNIDNNGEMKYGYIRRVWKNDENDCLQAKIFTCDNEMRVFEFKSKFSLDGVRQVYSVDELTNALSDSYGFLPQVIRYATNDEGKISCIDTTTRGDCGKYDMLSNSYAKTSGVRYRKNGSTFGNHLLIGEDTVLFRVPDEENASVRGTFDESKYSVVTISDFIGDSQYTVAGYTSDSERLVPELIVNYNSVAEIRATSPICVVTCVYDTLNLAGDAVKAVRYISSDGEGEGVMDSNDVLDDTTELEVGDVIRVGKNSSGEIEALQYLYSIKDGKDDTTAFGSSVANSSIDNHLQFSLTKAHIYKRHDNVISIAREDTITVGGALSLKDIAVYNTAYASVIVYDGERKNKVYSGDIADLVECTNGQVGDFVICYTNYSQLKTIYVIK